MVIRFAKADEYAEVLKLYDERGYAGGAHEFDKILIAVDRGIIGTVRLCTERGEKVLRGMQIRPAYQRKGLGSEMLHFLAGRLDMSGCYCLPYAHLKGFYSAIGFKEISPLSAPRFLSERLEKYLSSGNNEIIMMMIPHN
jgi:GNAT superfamily N-acetyltransferase